MHSQGRRYSYFGGNDYLGLSGHQDIKQASIQSIIKYGVNFAASRRTTGTADIHLELEKQLSVFKKNQDTVVFAAGYLGNSILLEVLKNKYNAVFIDQFAHPSISGGVPRETEKIYLYNHCDTLHLEKLLQDNIKQRALVITDGVFALTGEIAPLDKIYPLIQKFNAILVVDDAHSTGILGANGRGTPEYFDLAEAANIYQSETMSKAFGSYGGFISGDEDIIRLIRDTSTIYQASTAIPPPVVAAGIAALKIINEDPARRIRVVSLAGDIRQKIMNLGFQTTPDNTPIIPIMFSSYERASELSGFMENNGIIVPCVNYPVMHLKPMIRITVTANHTNQQAELLLELLNKWRDKKGTDYY